MARACSIGLNRPSVVERLGDAGGPRRAWSRATIAATAGGSSGRRSSPRASRARRSLEETGIGSSSKKCTRSRRSSCSRTCSRRSGGNPGRVATANLGQPQHLVGLAPGEEVAELVGADHEHRVVPLGVGAEELHGARVLVEEHLLVGERRPCECEPNIRRRVDALVPGIRRDEDDEARDAQLLLRAPREGDVARDAAGRTSRRRGRPHASSNSSSPTSTVVPSFAPAARRTRSSSSSDGGVPSTRNPPSVRRSRQPRAFGCGR